MATAKTEKKQGQDRGRRQPVTLARAKKHRGEWRRPGETIEVFPDQIERMRKFGEIEG